MCNTRFSEIVIMCLKSLPSTLNLRELLYILKWINLAKIAS